MISPAKFCEKLNQNNIKKYGFMTQLSIYRFCLLLIISITDNYLRKYKNKN